jgi:hypothetical protein
MSTSAAERNRNLGLAINRDIWNARRFELIPDYFDEDFVADYSPRVVRRGWADIEEAVNGAHRVFDGFREDVRHVIADDEHVVVHFTISGRQVEPWGPIPATNRMVSYDEIVIMTIRDGKVVHQIGVADNLLALQQVGAVPAPSGLAAGSSSES